MIWITSEGLKATSQKKQIQKQILYTSFQLPQRDTQLCQDLDN